MVLDPLLAVSAALVASVLVLVLVVRHYQERVARLRDQLRERESQKQSLATTYGRITEQWAPFMAGYPYDPRNFRFLGSPVDGVQFEEDRIVFVEFKANGSRLTPRERRLRELVEARQVEWLEFRLAERPAPPPSAWEAPPPPAEAPDATPPEWRRGPPEGA